LTVAAENVLDDLLLQTYFLTFRYIS